MFKKTRKDLVEHYAKMALNPATLDHARLRAKELEKDSSGLWIGIGKEIAQKIKELKNEH
jgi:hypothetical protein